MRLRAFVATLVLVILALTASPLAAASPAYTYPAGPTSYTFPLWVGGMPSGSSTDAWIYLSGQPSWAEFSLYSSSTLPFRLSGPLQLYGTPGGTSTDAILYMTSQPAGFEYGIYSASTLPSRLLGPLQLYGGPGGTSTDALLYLTSQPAGYEYSIYSASTLPSVFAGQLSADSLASTVKVQAPEFSSPGGVNMVVKATDPNSGTLVAGTSVTVRGSAGYPGGVGAAAGGTVYLYGGAGTQLISGDANGGDVYFTGGAAAGNGRKGKIFLNSVANLVPLDSPPATPEEGDIYSDTSHAICWYDGSAWQKLSGAGTCA